MKNMTFPAIAAFLLFANFACETMHSNPNLVLMSRGQTEDIVAEFTSNQKIYDGFMNRLDVSGTLHNSKVMAAVTDESARIFQWDKEQYKKEKQTRHDEMAKQTQVFLSFFVPERKEDDLNKATTRWKIFLDVNGRRYEGKATKLKTQISELVALYPHHTRWGTPYKISFEVPTTEVQRYQSRMTITGPPGSSTLSFSALDAQEESQLQ